MAAVGETVKSNVRERIASVRELKDKEVALVRGFIDSLKALEPIKGALRLKVGTGEAIEAFINKQIAITKRWWK